MAQTSSKITTTLNQLETFHLPRWEELPDFDVYMDQLITLINRYLNVFTSEEENIITPSMVNNYVKLKMIPKPIKKRYQRIHIAYLIAITLLKQVLTISEIRDGIELQTKISGLKGAYNLFCEEEENAIKAILKTFKNDREPSIVMKGFTKENITMKLCTLSLATKTISTILLNDKKESPKKSDDTQ